MVCTYQALVRGEQHCDAGVDLADGERDQHRSGLGTVVGRSGWLAMRLSGWPCSAEMRMDRVSWEVYCCNVL